MPLERKADSVGRRSLRGRRQGATDNLRLDAAGLEADARGRIEVDAHFRTAQPHIFAAGDVIGFPALAATSMEQGRLAACAAFGVAASDLSGSLPYGSAGDKSCAATPKAAQAASRPCSIEVAASAGKPIT